MTFIAKKNENKNFGKNATKIISIRVPENQAKSILTVMKEYVSNFREDNVQRIKTAQDGIEEIISMHLDVADYIWKENSITLSKYHSILFKHNKNLIDKLIANFPIERKTQPLMAIESYFEPSPIHRYRIGTPEYERELTKSIKKANKRKNR